MSSQERPDDEVLMLLVAEGSREALGELYSRLAPRLLGIALHILRSTSDAEDLVHDVFLQAWELAAEFDPERGSVLTWLSIRVRSRALDRLRHRSRHPAEDASAPPLEIANVDADPQDRAVAALTVRSALSVLPPEQLEVLLRVYFHGRTCQQVATTLGLPLGTVKSRLAAALQKLRALALPP